MKIALVGSSGYISGFLIKKFQSESRIDQIVKIDKIGETDAYLDLEKADEFSYSILDGVDFVIFLRRSRLMTGAPRRPNTVKESMSREPGTS